MKILADKLWKRQGCVHSGMSAGIRSEISLYKINFLLVYEA